VPPETLIRLAAVFYGAMVVAGLVWGALAGQPVLWAAGPPPGLASLGLGLLSGVAFALVVVVATRLLARVGWMEALLDWFRATIGPLSWSDAAWLAGMSAVGEEVFFRGAMQPQLGLIPTTVIFALVHYPGDRRLWSWTVFAAVVGLALGASVERFGHLAPAVAAHFLINLLNLKAIGDRPAPPA
jgi:membrane protease YdiL (CAAX protease family)